MRNTLIFILLTYTSLVNANQMKSALEERQAGVPQRIDEVSNPTIVLDPFNQQELADHYLKTNIHCSYKCQRTQEQEVILQLPFVPSQEGLTPGDGSSSKEHVMWRGLTATLRLWSQEACIREASRQCKGEEKVESVKSKEIYSGDWKWDNQIGCDKNTPIILSPFGDKMNVDTTAVGKGLLANPKQLLATIDRPILCDDIKIAAIKIEYKIFPSMESFRKMRPLKLTPTNKISEGRRDLHGTTTEKNLADEKCVNKVNVNFCFGDCIDLKQKDFPETLMTPNPSVNEELTVCLDEWKEKVGKSKLSNDILQWSCESNVWQQLKEKNVLGLSCAAARIIVKCPNFQN
jgi:hypothetical protein